MRRALKLLLVPAGVLAIACGEDAIDPVTGGEGNGATGFSVFITDDPSNDPSPVSGAPRGPRAITGDMSGSVRVSLRNDAGALVSIGTAQDIEILLQSGNDSTLLSDLSRPNPDTYVSIQLRFEGMNVRVEDGSEVGDTILTQDAVLAVGSGGVATIEIATDQFDVSSETEMDIVVDLNSELWITTDNVEDEIVPQSDLAATVTAEVL